jgi:uncharacterized protein involved in exopolysaccharide biosynthesis/Mrp family chromosome partitioning ATPase
MDLTAWQTSLRDLLFVAFKRRWSALMIVGGGIFAVLFWIFFIREDSYEATAKILVKIGHEQSSPSTVAVPPVLITGERIQDVNSEADILTSTDLLTQVIDDFKLDQAQPPAPPPTRLVARIRYEIRTAIARVRALKDTILIAIGFKERLSPREIAIAEFRQRLIVEPIRNSNVLLIRLRVDQRRDAGALLNGHLDRYLTFRLGIYRGTATEEYFRAEIDAKAKGLRAAEETLQQFADRWNISAIEKQKEVLLGQIADAETQFVNSDIEFQEAADRAGRAEAVMGSDNPDVAAIGAFSANSFPATTLAQLADLQRERENLRMTELDNGIRISNNRKQFQVLMDMLAAHLKSAAAEKKGIFEQRKLVLEGLQNQISDLKSREAAWNDLNRRVRVAEHSFLTFREKMENAAATDALEKQNIGSVAILERAIDPLLPIGISKTRILGLTVILSIFVAFAWISLAEYFDHRIYTPEELEAHLDSPVLDAVPARKLSVGTFSQLSLSERDAPFRRISWALANMTTNPGKTVAFSSTAHGDGTTTTILAVARQIGALYGLRTLVLELDGRYAVCVNALDLDAERTLDAYVDGRKSAEECIQQHSSGIQVLPAGRTILSAVKLAELLEVLRPDFDLILADTPPVPDPNSLPIRGVIKQAVLIVESGRRRYEVIDRSKQLLEADGVSVVGVVLTKYKRYIPSWVYRWLLQ